MTNPDWHRGLDGPAMAAVRKGLDAWMDSDDDGPFPFLEGLGAGGYKVVPISAPAFDGAPPALNH